MKSTSLDIVGVRYRKHLDELQSGQEMFLQRKRRSMLETAKFMQSDEGNGGE